MPKRWIAALLSVSLLFGTLSQATPVLLSVGGEENGLVVQAGTVRLNAESGSYSFSGGVKILGDGFSLSANQGRYDARTDQLSVSGNVRVRIEDESVISASALQYNGTSGAWQAEDFGLVSDDGERVAARRAVSADGVAWQLEKVAYTPCEVCADDPNPDWQLRAGSARLGVNEQQIYMEEVQFVSGNRVLLTLPYLQVASQEAERLEGWLRPTLDYSSQLGLSVGLSYFWPMGTARDVTLGGIGHFERLSPDALSTTYRYRQAFTQGTLQFTGQTTAIAEASGGYRADDFTLGQTSFGSANRLEAQFMLHEQLRLKADWMTFSDASYPGRFGFYDPSGKLNEVALSWSDGRSRADVAIIDDWDLGDTPRQTMRLRPSLRFDLYRDAAPGQVFNIEGRWRALTLAGQSRQRDADLRLSQASSWRLEPFSLGSWAAVSLGASSAEDGGSGQRADLSLSLHGSYLSNETRNGSRVRPWVTLAGSQQNSDGLSPASLVNSAPLLSAQDLARAQDLSQSLDRAPFPTGIAALGIDIQYPAAHTSLALAQVDASRSYAPVSSGLNQGLYLLLDSLWQPETGYRARANLQASEEDALRHATLAIGYAESAYNWSLGLTQADFDQRQTRLNSSLGGVINANWDGSLALSYDLERADHFTLTSTLDYLEDCIGFEFDMTYAQDGKHQKVEIEVRMGLEQLGDFMLGQLDL